MARLEKELHLLKARMQECKDQNKRVLELKRRKADLLACMNEKQQIALTRVIEELEKELAVAVEKKRALFSAACRSSGVLQGENSACRHTHCRPLYLTRTLSLPLPACLCLPASACLPLTAFL